MVVSALTYARYNGVYEITN